MNTLPRCMISVTLALAAAAAHAHHGWSEYDSAKTLKVSGVIKEAGYEHPHGHVQLETAGKTWLVVLAPPSRMSARGLPAAELKPGTQGRSRRLCESQQARRDARRAHHDRRQDDRAALMEHGRRAARRARVDAARGRDAAGAVALSRSSRSCTSRLRRAGRVDRRVSICACSGLSRALPVRALARHVAAVDARRASSLIVPTGLLMFIAHASDFVTNRAFQLKLVLILLAARQRRRCFTPGVTAPSTQWDRDVRAARARRGCTRLRRSRSGSA